MIDFLGILCGLVAFFSIVAISGFFFSLTFHYAKNLTCQDDLFKMQVRLLVEKAIADIFKDLKKEIEKEGEKQ